jgi:hypothetical protein
LKRSKAGLYLLEAVWGGQGLVGHQRVPVSLGSSMHYRANSDVNEWLPVKIIAFNIRQSAILQGTSNWRLKYLGMATAANIPYKTLPRKMNNEECFLTCNYVFRLIFFLRKW